MDCLSSAISERYATPAAFFYSTYEYTDCGAQAGICVYEIIHAPTATDPYQEAGGARWVYDARTLPATWADFEAAGVTVVSVSVSSCVEGIDATTATYCVEAEHVTDAAAFYVQWDAAVAAVEAEAAALWGETHGCPTCATHYGIDLDFDLSPVWYECPDCAGEGDVI